MLKAGYVVYCDLIMGMEHSGIYLGNGMILELNGEGEQVIIEYNKFLNYSTNRVGDIIYGSCNIDGKLLYSFDTAARAIKSFNKKTKYNLIANNCHQFVTSCITGNIINFSSLFSMLEENIEKYHNLGQPIIWLPLEIEDISNSRLEWSLSFFNVLKKILYLMDKLSKECCEKDDKKLSKKLKEIFNEVSFKEIIQKATPKDSPFLFFYKKMISLEWEKTKSKIGLNQLKSLLS